MTIDPTDVAFDRPVPLFPLPNVVLFPGTTQSLQVFEPRYREMVADTLGQAGLIAMALLAEPDLLNRIQADRTVKSACTHCNLCMPTIYTRTHGVVTGKPN